VTWGAADFGGGVTSRNAPVLWVALLVQPVGASAALVVAILSRETVPGAGPVALALLAGVAGVIGLINLYHGLALGRMGVVAPVTGLLAAVVPVTAGILFEGLPAPPVLLGILLGLAAVVLVSRVRVDEGGRTGVEFGVAAGLGLGSLALLLSQIPAGHVFGSIVLAKIAGALVVGLVMAVRGRGRQVPRSALPAILWVGLLDMAGVALFVLASQAGRLDVAAVLSSLYPVVTVILAATFLRERLAQSHLLGIGVAIIAIGLIASGSSKP
jgi:drug/metabolite transporter (DMT)-like permease